MAYKYKKVKRTITLGANPGEKYLAAMAVEGKLKNEDLIEYIEQNSSISKADITILFEALATVIEENLNAGRGVNFASLGTFSPNLKTSGEATADEVTADNIEKVTVNFRPSSELKKAMEDAPVKETTRFKLTHV